MSDVLTNTALSGVGNEATEQPSAEILPCAPQDGAVPGACSNHKAKPPLISPRVTQLVALPVALILQPAPSRDPLHWLMTQMCFDPTLNSSQWLFLATMWKSICLQ